MRLRHFKRASLIQCFSDYPYHSSHIDAPPKVFVLPNPYQVLISSPHDYLYERVSLSLFKRSPASWNDDRLVFVSSIFSFLNSIILHEDEQFISHERHFRAARCIMVPVRYRRMSLGLSENDAIATGGKAELER